MVQKMLDELSHCLTHLDIESYLRFFTRKMASGSGGTKENI